MNYTIEFLPKFIKELKRLQKKYRSIENDVDKLMESLSVNPSQGADLSGGVRKVRMAISDKGKGKSGGAKVITYTVCVDEAAGRITMLTVYDKSEQDSIGKAEIAELLEEVKTEEKE